jgi:acyl carrier protein
MNDLKQEVRGFVVETFLFGQAGDLGDGTSFLEKGIIDSTGVMELIAHLEKTYGIKVEDTDLVPENLDSIDAVASFLERKLAIACHSSP